MNVTSATAAPTTRADVEGDGSWVGDVEPPLGAALLWATDLALVLPTWAQATTDTVSSTAATIRAARRIIEPPPVQRLRRSSWGFGCHSESKRHVHDTGAIMCG